MSRPTLSLALAGLLLAGCAVGSVAPAAKRSAAPRASKAPDAGSARLPAGIVALSGAVRLLSNNGAGIISNNGGAIISNNGGSIISDNGGSVVSNNGGKYVLAQAPKAAEALLAEAEIAVLDAAGRPVMGPDGKPLAGKTDKQGRYAFQAALPAGNVVLRVKLWNGGELSAMLARGADAREVVQDVDTASSLGAAYVLDRFVKGEQAVLDKLPAAEARRLQAEMEGARAQLPQAPAYTAQGLVAAAEDLRGKVPAVAKTLEDIRVLLIGQAKLGDGRLATEVPLNRPYGVLPRPDGTLLLAEGGLGRIRTIGRDGQIGTFADAVRGTLKQNFQGARDLLAAPDGTLYLACTGDRRLYRIAPDGQVALVPLGGTGGFLPRAIHLEADGTLHAAGSNWGLQGANQARWVTIAPDGREAVRTLPAVPAGHDGVVLGLAPAPDGGMYVYLASQLAWSDEPQIARIFLVPREGAARELVGGIPTNDDEDMVAAPDGTLYFSAPVLRKLFMLRPDGTKLEVPGPEAAGGAAFDQPSSLHLAADGTLHVSDIGASRVWRRDPDGRWTAIAGIDGAGQVGQGAALALNTPMGLAFDAQGRLLIAENGRHRVQRLEGGRLEPVTGSTKGLGKEAVPALDAQYFGIPAIAARGDELIVVDGNNSRLRRLGADGLVRTIAGLNGSADFEAAGRTFPADDVGLNGATGLALDPAGRPFWTDRQRNQVLRLTEPGRVDVVAGPTIPVLEAPTLAQLLADEVPASQDAASATFRFPLGLAFDAAGDLYVADAAHMQIRKIVGAGGATPRVEAFAGRGLATYGTLMGAPADLLRDGARAEVDLLVPAGLCFDPAGNLYVTEIGTRRLDLLGQIVEADLGFGGGALPPSPARVRKIAPDGTVTTIAGPGGKFFTDPDAEDALVLPTAIAFAPDGRLVIADPGANLVRVFPAGSF